MNSLDLVVDKNLVKNFQWKDRHNNYHYPKDMKTSHLFYVIRMIWNHSVSNQYKVDMPQEYIFGSFYTNDYMREAFKNIFTELMTRNLTEYMISTLSKIQTLVHLINGPKQIGEQTMSEPNDAIYKPEIREFKGHKILAIPTGGGYSVSFGLSKAKAILEHLDEISTFVETNGRSFEPEDESEIDKPF